MPGYFQSVFQDGQHLMSSIAGDTIVKTSDGSRLLFGIGDETSTPLVTLTKIDGVKDVFIDANLQVNEINVNTVNINSNSVSNLLVADEFTVEGKLKSINESDFEGRVSFTPSSLSSNTLHIYSNSDVLRIDQDGATVFQVTQEGFLETSTLSVNGTVNVNGDSLFSNLVVDGPTFRIPHGEEDKKPNADLSDVGTLFYNESKKRFEGVSLLATDTAKGWLPLGGLIDDNGDTFISAVDFQNNNNDILYFHTSNSTVPVTIMDKNVLSINLDVVITKDLTVDNSIVTTRTEITDSLSVGSNVYTSNIFTSNVITQNITILDDITIADTLSIGSNVYTSNMVASNVITQNITILDDITISDTLSIGSNVYTSNMTASNVVTQNITVLDDATIFDTLSIGSNVYTSNIETLRLVADALVTSNEVVHDSLSVGSNVFTSNIETNVFTGNNVEFTDGFVRDSLSVSNTVHTSNLVGDFISVSNLDVLNDLSIQGTIYTTQVITGTSEINNINTSNITVSDTVTTSNLISSNINCSNLSTFDHASTNIVSQTFLSRDITSSNAVIKSSLSVLGPMKLDGIFETTPYSLRFRSNMTVIFPKKNTNPVSPPEGSLWYNNTDKQFYGSGSNNIYFNLGNKYIKLDSSTNNVKIYKSDSTTSAIRILDSDNQIQLNLDCEFDSNVNIVNTLTTSNLTTTGDSVMSSLSVNTVHFDEALNITSAGNLTLSSNLDVNGILKVNNVVFPMNPTLSDVSKVLAVNSTSNYQLMSLFQEKFACEFKSLFGTFQTGIELDQFSGLFDFGVPKNWLTGWNASLFDSVTFIPSGTGTTPTPGVEFLVPGDTSNVDMSTLQNLETYDTSNMNFQQFLNISTYKANGQKHTDLSGIAVTDDYNVVTPNYYFLIGTIDPNNELFKYKFKHDFERFYNPADSSGKQYPNYGYSPVLDSIRVPHQSFHRQGTNMFMVEFINTYNNTPVVSSTWDSSNVYHIPTSEPERRSNYHLNEDGASFTSKTNEIGLFPHITYTLWRNSVDAKFYTTKSNNDIGWNNGNAFDAFELYSNNGLLKTLYHETYAFIYPDGTATASELDTFFDTNIKSSNIQFHSNLNSNGNFVANNYNSITFVKDVTFPQPA